MKKRIFALLLAFVMLVGMFPVKIMAAGGSGQVRVTVENNTYADGAWTGTLVETWEDIDASSTAMTCLVAALDAAGYTQTGAEDNYISEINGLWAMSAGGMDGWMILVNDWFINTGAGAITVADGTLESGDEIKIVYSMNAGEDYGGSWSNNDKTVNSLYLSTGTLSPSFEGATHEYTLTVSADTTSVVVTPSATNRNFQVRTTVEGTQYKRSAAIPVAEGTVITITCGDPSWPSMNNGDYGSGAESVPAEV